MERRKKEACRVAEGLLSASFDSTRVAEGLLSAAPRITNDAVNPWVALRLRKRDADILAAWDS